MAPSSRRAMLCGVAALPALTLPGVAAPSDLALVCDYAITQRQYIDGDHGSWSEERAQAEYDKFSDAFKRAITEPSRSLGDLAAKARLMLDDLEQCGHLPAVYDDERLTETILREIVAFDAQAKRGRL